MPTETDFDNGITVYCDGKTRHLELDKEQAERFLWYAGVASEADSVPHRKLTEEEMENRRRRRQTMEENARTFKTYLSMLAQLDDDDLAHVIAFMDLLEYGDSWMRETICDLLREVQFSGPAKANERNPRDVLADVAYNLFDWWDNIDTARSRAAQHPRLFQPPTTPEPPPAEAAQPTGKQPTKATGARKPRRKVTAA